MQEMLGLCEAKDGAEMDELLQAGASMHKRARQDVKNEFSSLKMAGSLPRRQETGKLKDKRGELSGRNIKNVK